jgi:hypothetical protein
MNHKARTGCSTSAPGMRSPARLALTSRASWPSPPRRTAAVYGARGHDVEIDCTVYEQRACVTRPHLQQVCWRCGVKRPCLNTMPFMKHETEYRAQTAHQTGNARTGLLCAPHADSFRRMPMRACAACGRADFKAFHCAVRWLRVRHLRCIMQPCRMTPVSSVIVASQGKHRKAQISDAGRSPRWSSHAALAAWRTQSQWHHLR